MEIGLRIAALFSGFSSNCFRKIEARAMVTTAMTTPIDSAIPDIAGIVSSGRSREKAIALASRRKSLKRLNSDKPIQDNARVFLG